jgi:mannosyltransferase
MADIRRKVTSLATTIKDSALHLRPDFLFYAGILPLAAVLTLLFLGEKSIWLDEAFSVTIAQMEWPDFFYTLSHYEANGGFYYFLLHLWVNLGQSEFALRSLSVIFALGVVVMIYRLGVYLNGTRTGLVAALLATLNAFFILFAQEARGYMLALLLTTLSAYFFLHAIEKSGWKWWAA